MGLELQRALKQAALRETHGVKAWSGQVSLTCHAPLVEHLPSCTRQQVGFFFGDDMGRTAWQAVVLMWACLCREETADEMRFKERIAAAKKRVEAGEGDELASAGEQASAVQRLVCLSP